ncbi:MAG: hypothetical protein AAF602_01305, partial [Myxococcota bacterium]
PLMDVPLEQPHRVFGRVVTPGGEPVAGAAVSMELWRGTVDIQPVAVTDRGPEILTALDSSISKAG